MILLFHRTCNLELLSSPCLKAVAEVAELKAEPATLEASWDKRDVEIFEANTTLQEQAILLDHQRKKLQAEV